MTDYPRFRAPRVDPDQVYRFYFGAPQVDLLFRLVDTLRGRARPVPFPALVACAAMAIAIAIASAGVSAQEQVRVRGTIESVEGDTFMVKARAGDLLRLKLAPNANVAASVKAQVSDIGKGAYIGVAALPQADGSLHALEAHIFHDSMRGTGEGHRPWDLLPQSTMTNATVYDVVHAVDGHRAAKVQGG